MLDPIARALALKHIKSKADLVNGKVPAAQLPSYVSDIVEVETYADLPQTGQTNTIYVVKTPSQATYRWTGSTYIATDEKSQYYSMKIDSSSITTMEELRTYVDNINNTGLHCLFDFSDYITNAYVCTVLMFTQSAVNYCLVFDIINGKTYIDYGGYADADTVAAYVARTGDNIPRIITLSDNTIKVADIETMLDEINTIGHHVLFDMHALATNCYLCSVLIDSQNSSVTVVDMIGMKIANATYDSDTTLVSVLAELGSISEPLMVSTTYADLLTLKNNNQLVPGTKYRITDYQTVVNPRQSVESSVMDDAIQSAGHQFDIIVTALTENMLDVNAKACKHEGDLYFASTNFSKWKLKYDIDGSLAIYDWVDTTAAAFKGVIFYMKDEFDNECYYDFKNIQMKGAAYWIKTGWTQASFTLADNNYYYLFSKLTFNDGSTGNTTAVDASMLGFNTTNNSWLGAHSNIIEAYCNSPSNGAVARYSINFSLFTDIANHVHTKLGCYGIIIHCYPNATKIEIGCETKKVCIPSTTADIVIGSNCSGIKGYNSYSSYQYYPIRSTKIGNNCSSITQFHSYNTIGNDCYNINISSDTYQHYGYFGATIGDKCNDITLNASNNPSYARGGVYEIGIQCTNIQNIPGLTVIGDFCSYLTFTGKPNEPAYEGYNFVVENYVTGSSSKPCRICSNSDLFSGNASSIYIQTTMENFDRTAGSHLRQISMYVQLTDGTQKRWVYDSDTYTWTAIPEKHLYRHCIAVKNQNSQVWLTFELILESATAITSYNDLRDAMVEDMNYIASGMYTNSETNFNYVTTVMYIEKHIYNGSTFIVPHGNSIKFNATTNEYAGIINDHGFVKTVQNTDTITDTVEQIM